MKFLRQALIIVPAAILFLSAPAHPHGDEKSGDKHSTPKLVGVVEESARGVEEPDHGGGDHHAFVTLDPAMGEEHLQGAKQRLKKYVAEELHQAALNKAKAEAAERNAMEETDRLKYRTAFAVFGIFILIVGLVLRYAPGRRQR